MRFIFFFVGLVFWLLLWSTLFKLCRRAFERLWLKWCCIWNFSALEFLTLKSFEILELYACDDDSKLPFFFAQLGIDIGPDLGLGLGLFWTECLTGSWPGFWTWIMSVDFSDKEVTFDIFKTSWVSTDFLLVAVRIELWTWFQKSVSFVCNGRATYFERFANFRKSYAV